LRTGPSPIENAELGIHEFVGTFDVGAYCHVIFVHDSVEEATQEGLQGMQAVLGQLDSLINNGSATLSARPDYRKGMTLLIHGGLGRGFAGGFGRGPQGWQNLGMSLHDFMLLSFDHDFSALRAWKLLEQEDAMENRSSQLMNPFGFLNFYGYAFSQNFETVPPDTNEGVIFLAPNWVAPLRRRLRQTFDYHVAPSAEGDSWIEVQRQGTAVFFKEMEYQPIYVSAGFAAIGTLLGCMETRTRPWWIECTERADDRHSSSIVYQVWDMALNWMFRVAPELEKEFSGLPQGPIGVKLTFSDISQWTTDIKSERKRTAPDIAIENQRIVIDCTCSYLRSFREAHNIGDKMMIAALIEGASRLCSSPLTSSEAMSLADRLVPNSNARFLHTIPARNPTELIYAAVAISRPRFVQPEDEFWRNWELAYAAGYSGKSRALSQDEAKGYLLAAVDFVWAQIRERLANLNRTSVIERALVNHDAIGRDRAQWRMTAAALIALHSDRADVIAAANARENERAEAGLACRIAAEMALCAAPFESGVACSNADLDALLADVSTLIRVAYERDAIYYGLTSQGLFINANGSFGFDSAFLINLQRPYIEAVGERAFLAAADSYGDAFKLRTSNRTSGPDPSFMAAFQAEFGIELPHLFDFEEEITRLAMQQSSTLLRLPRVRVLKLLTREHNSSLAARALEALTLAPRPRWDEEKPVNAKARDWYPWRFNRRLSLIRRPLIQLTNSIDSEMLLCPTLIDRSLRFLCEAYSGQIPVELFDSAEMRAWIGHAVNREGHRFNETVRDRLRELGLEAEIEVKVTALGGAPELGDLDVLAWRKGGHLAYAIECKRLTAARTVGEIGERLQEYARPSRSSRKRSPMEKHLDRIAFLYANPEKLRTVTGIKSDGFQVKSCLVTDRLVPMQFSREALSLLDIVVDFQGLTSAGPFL
jgi:hypothetical protein